jgi:hypothetical protein
VPKISDALIDERLRGIGRPFRQHIWLCSPYLVGRSTYSGGLSDLATMPLRLHNMARGKKLA